MSTKLSRRDFIKLASAFAGMITGGATVSKAASLITEPEPIVTPELLTGQQHALLHGLPLRTDDVNTAPAQILLTGPPGCGKSWALARWMAEGADDPQFRGAYITAAGAWHLDHIESLLRSVRSKDFGRLKFNQATSTVTWPSGGRVMLRSLDMDPHKLWGQELDRIVIDGSPNLWDASILELRACCRVRLPPVLASRYAEPPEISITGRRNAVIEYLHPWSALVHKWSALNPGGAAARHVYRHNSPSPPPADVLAWGQLQHVLAWGQLQQRKEVPRS
jgi:hypothetical protein